MAGNTFACVTVGTPDRTRYAIKIPGHFDRDDNYIPDACVKGGTRRLEIECLVLAEHLAAVHRGKVMVVCPMITEIKR